MRRPVLLGPSTCWLFFVLASADLAAPTEPGAPARPSQAAEVQDIVYLAPDRPVFIRFRIRVLGAGFRELRARYARRLFRSIDKDGDGLLNAAETRNIPPSDRLLPPRGPEEEPRTFNIEPVDSDADGIVRLEELIEYVRKSTGSPFVVKLAPPLRAGKVDLFRAVDRDGNGRLEAAEIVAAGGAILRFDANDDQIIDESELSTDLGRALSRRQPEESTELLSRLVAVDREAENVGVALFARLVEVYDRPHASGVKSSDVPAGDGQLDAGELRVHPERFVAWDSDGDGRLNVAEARHLALNPEPDVELIAVVGEKSGFAVADPVSPDAENGPPGIAASVADHGGIELTVGGQVFDLSMGSGASPLASVRSKFDKDFDAADADNNDYLDREELRQLGIQQSAVPAVDSNSDRMVRKDELLRYAELEALLCGSRVVLLLSREAESMLDCIDQEADDRLGLRELRDAPQRILRWDLNEDGRIELGETPANSRLLLQNGETMLFRRQAIRDRRQQVPGRSQLGPRWFNSMDRNRDGDLSPREFLGKIQVFERLDANHDGLLSAAEAMQPMQLREETR